MAADNANENAAAADDNDWETDEEPMEQSAF